MSKIPHASVVAGALLIGWVIFMVYHGDLPGFLWILGIGGGMPPYCTFAGGATAPSGTGVNITLSPGQSTGQLPTTGPL